MWFFAPGNKSDRKKAEKERVTAEVHQKEAEKARLNEEAQKEYDENRRKEKE